MTHHAFYHELESDVAQAMHVAFRWSMMNPRDFLYHWTDGNQKQIMRSSLMPVVQTDGIVDTFVQFNICRRTYIPFEVTFDFFLLCAVIAENTVQDTPQPVKLPSGKHIYCQFVIQSTLSRIAFWRHTDRFWACPIFEEGVKI